MGLATDVLSTMRNGAADRAMSELLAQVALAVQQTGKKGSVTLKLDVGKLKGGDTELEIKASLKSSLPHEDIPVGIYYSDDKGVLTRNDPRQATMFDADTPNGRVMTIAGRRMAGVTGDDLV